MYNIYEFESFFSPGLATGMMVFLCILLVVMLTFVILGIVATWKVFEKAGQAGWKSIIPFYSIWVLIEIAGLSWWWFLLMIADSVVTILV